MYSIDKEDNLYYNDFLVDAPLTIINNDVNETDSIDESLIRDEYFGDINRKKIINEEIINNILPENLIIFDPLQHINSSLEQVFSEIKSNLEND